MSSIQKQFVQACADSDFGRVQKLYEKVEDVNGVANVLMKGAKRLSPLDAAISNNCFVLVKWLIEVANAEVNISLADGATPLSRAASMQRLQMIQYMLCLPQMDPNFVGHSGVPALHVAAMGVFARSGGACALTMLAGDSRVNIDAQDSNGRTALMLASEAGKMSVCEYLLERNANVNVKAQSDESALSVAARRGHDDVAHRLLRAGADPNAFLLDDVQGSLTRRKFVLSLGNFFPHLFGQSDKRQARDAPDYGFQWRHALFALDSKRVFSNATLLSHLAPLVVRARLVSCTRLFRLHIASPECRIFALKSASSLNGRAFFKDVLLLCVEMIMQTEEERSEWQLNFSEADKYNLIDSILKVP